MTKRPANLVKRPKGTPETREKRRLEAEVASSKDPQHERAKARLFLAPATAAAVAASGYMKTFGEPEADVPALMDTLKESMQRVNEGDLREAEAMLIGQAHALQAIFMHLAYRAARITQLRQYELEMRLALKAQAQCCRTLETLAALKNPPVVVARQANVTTGPQQVNNNMMPSKGSAPAHVDPCSPQNELLECTDGERVDPRAKSKAG